jgi:hypothetical protein
MTHGKEVIKCQMDLEEDLEEEEEEDGDSVLGEVLPPGLSLG